ncbi:MAG TPA: response regulator [Candidatus Binatia bacterium]|nr:response regulator [Candidatus Binatia bacterium]
MSDRVNILIVDDSTDKLVALRAILEQLGQNIVTATSGRDALRLLLRQDFAVILLDVRMPTMDGFETAALIRQRPRSEHTPIIFITAFGDETHVSRGYSLGAVDYILTPVLPEVLRAKVAVFVDLFRKSEQIRRQAEAMRERAVQLHQVTEAALAINAAQSVDEILGLVTEHARRTLGADGAVSHVDLAPGRSHDAHAGVEIAVDEQVAAVVRTRGRPLRTAIDRSRHREDGDGAGFAVLAAPLLGRDGRAMGVVQLVRDPAVRFAVRDEDILVQLAQMTSIAIENTLFIEAREANRLKDEFLATLSHELRTPLTSILAWARLLRAGTLDPAAMSRGLEVIERNARAQAKLIEDALEMSRIITGKVHLELRALDPAAVVQAALDAIAPTAEARGVTVTAALERLGDVVLGDPDRLQQVMWNLLSNAIKFTPKDGRVHVGLSRTASTVEIAVSDTGRGIDPAFLPHVFEPFRQADSSTTRAHGGLGLGLAIVRHLVELHGGTVRAESAGDGHGAVFAVRLPLATGDARRRRLEESHPQPADDLDGEDAHLPRLDDVRILLVEDEPDARDVLTTILDQAGASVTAVASAPAAFAAMEERVPDVLLSDIGLPGEDGYALIRRVRALPPAAGGSVPAIALTAYARLEDRARALAAGYDAHIPKPIEPRRFLATLGELLGGAPRGPALQHSVTPDP